MRQYPIKLRRGFPSHTVMKLQTMLDILNDLEGSIDFQEDEDLRDVVSEFYDCLILRYQNIHWEMKQSGDYTYPKHLLQEDISTRLRQEFQPIYQLHQYRMRNRKPE